MCFPAEYVSLTSGRVLYGFRASPFSPRNAVFAPFLWFPFAIRLLTSPCSGAASDCSIWPFALASCLMSLARCLGFRTTALKTRFYNAERERKPVTVQNLLPDCYRTARHRASTGWYRTAKPRVETRTGRHRTGRHGTAQGDKRCTKFARRGSGVRIPSSPPARIRPTRV